MNDGYNKQNLWKGWLIYMEQLAASISSVMHVYIFQNTKTLK